MKKIIAFLLLFLVSLLLLLFSALNGNLLQWIGKIELPFYCALSGGFGGIIYCLRGVYINACVRKNWDDAWQPWYYIRPFVSLVSGGVSWIFLKAGLLILEAAPSNNATDLGFYALAFIAGLNVDKFISKIEDIAQATWGIEKSRASRDAGEQR
jgi:hypothetical protein